MSSFENVSVQKEANSYFGGQVTSRTLTFADGTVKTLGIMLPGEYEFATGDPELMEIYSGELEVKLPGSDTWIHVGEGERFNVEGNARFRVRARSLTDYCCTFLKEG